MKRAESVDPASRFDRCVEAFEREFDYLHGVLRCNGVDAAEVEDLVHEVFLVMWRRWSDYQADRPLRPWLAGIAVNLAWRSVSRRRREVMGGAPDIMEPLSPLDERVAARTLVARALAQVPITNRAAMVLHDLEGVSMRDVAETLEVPLTTAYTRLGRGRKAFAVAVRNLLQSERAGAVPQRVRALAPAGLLDLFRDGVASPLGELRRRAVIRARASSAGWAGAPGAATSAWSSQAVRGTVYVACAGALALLFTVATRPLRDQSGAATVAAGSALGDAEAPASGAAAVGPAARFARPRLTLASILPSPIAAASLAQGLAGYWRFDEGVASTRALDLSGGGNDCRLQRVVLGQTWAQGAMGGGLRLGNTGGWVWCVQKRTKALPGAEFTVGAWVKPSTARGHFQSVVAHQRQADFGHYYLLGVRRGRAVLMSDVWRLKLESPLPRGLNAWTHIAFTHAADGTTRLFVDGVPVATATAAATGEVALNKVITLGHSRDQVLKRSFHNYYGDLDELLIHDRVLSEGELAALAAGTQPRLSN